jgi:hypothetical protein
MNVHDPLQVNIVVERRLTTASAQRLEELSAEFATVALLGRAEASIGRDADWWGFSTIERVAKRDYFAVTNVEINVTIGNFDSLDELANVEVRDAGPGVCVRILANIIRVTISSILSSELVDKLDGDGSWARGCRRCERRRGGI